MLNPITTILIFVATEIILTFTEGPKLNTITRFNGEEDNIIINNDNFDDANDFYIEARNLPEVFIQLQNKGDTNGMSYEVYGSIDKSGTLPSFSLITWTLLQNATGNLLKETNDLLRSNISLIWILIRLKRTTTLLDTTAKILVGSGAIK